MFGAPTSGSITRERVQLLIKLHGRSSLTMDNTIPISLDRHKQNRKFLSTPSPKLVYLFKCSPVFLGAVAMGILIQLPHGVSSKEFFRHTLPKKRRSKEMCSPPRNRICPSSTCLSLLPPQAFVPRMSLCHTHRNFSFSPYFNILQGNTGSRFKNKYTHVSQSTLPPPHPLPKYKCLGNS